MIQLTRLNNKPLTVNSDLIKYVEQSPDTLVTLITGGKTGRARKTRRGTHSDQSTFGVRCLQGLSLRWDFSPALALVIEVSRHPGRP